jgi:hypothetical protein
MPEEAGKDGEKSAAYSADCLTWIIISRLKLLQDSAAIPFGLIETRRAVVFSFAMVERTPKGET